MEGRVNYGFFQMVASDLKIDGSAFVDRHTGKHLHKFEDSRDVKWLAHYIYNKYYACDDVGLNCLIDGDYWPFVLEQYDPNIYRAITAGCQHRHFRDYSWTIASSRKSPGYASESEAVVISNGLVFLKCNCSDVGTAAGKQFALMPAVQRYLIPGWICITGQYGFHPKKGAYIYRYYHALQSDAAIKDAVSNITATLNKANVQYRLKIVNQAERLGRNDALVLYTMEKLSDKYLASISAGFPESLPHRIPPLTIGQGCGWGFAYEKASKASNGQSYGMFCCSVVAEAICSAAKCFSAEQVASAVADAFITLGRNPMYPYALIGENPV